MAERVRISTSPGRVTRMAWVTALAIVVGLIVLPLAAYGRNGPPDHANGQPAGGPPLSPPVGPPLSPPVGPPAHWFDFEQPLHEYWFGCSEIVLIHGTEWVKSDIRTGPSDNELFRFTIVWDAVGIGQSTGDQYAVSFREQLVAMGWPPLTPPTSNIVTYGATLTLRSEDSNQRYRVISHRVIHWDDELGEATLTGTFVKDWQRCK